MPVTRDYLSIPTTLTVYTDQENIELPTIHESVEANLTNHDHVVSLKDHHIAPLATGEADVIYTFNQIPMKKVSINVEDRKHLIPGGHSIGVNLKTEGVLVVGYHQLMDEDAISPAKDAGIKVGDYILSIDGTDINHIEDIEPVLNSAGESERKVSVDILRSDNVVSKEIAPEYDEESGSYKMGVYIRDSTSGIGTMTFIDPTNRQYGALGHSIADPDTHQSIQVKTGQIMPSTITSILKGEKTKPGEKKASFSDDDVMGDIDINSSYGVFGTLDVLLDNALFKEPLPITKPDEVKEGPAELLTVIDDETIERFDIEIINNIDQDQPATKGMIIKVTDERLLDQTGGIVQGMSGSPIIQNDHIVGAVTHVFVNDPSSGYGIHIEWMLHELNDQSTENMAIAS